MRRHLFSMLFALLTTTLLAQTVRPVRDNVGFCWTKAEMEKLIAHLQNGETEAAPKDIVAGVSVHDDYLYAGRVYFPLFQALRTKEVVIFGVTHGTVRREVGDRRGIVLMDSYEEWAGPLGPVKPSPLRELLTQRLTPNMMRIDNKAHELEHSIEALIPFIQYFNPDVRITPIMVTTMEFGRMDTVAQSVASVISAYIRKNDLKLGRDIVFLMSSDANHYGMDFNNAPFGEDADAHQKSTENDLRIAKTYLAGPIIPDKIHMLAHELTSVVWCGRYSVPFGLLTAQKVVRDLTGHSLHGELLRYSDTFTEGVLPLKGTTLGLTAPFSLKHWVGFLTAAYTME